MASTTADVTLGFRHPPVPYDCCNVQPISLMGPRATNRPGGKPTVPRSYPNAELAETHTESIGISPSDTAYASRSKTIEAQFERFGKAACSRKLETRAVIGHIANRAINQRRLIAKCYFGDQADRVSLELPSFSHGFH
jgi:hypothetical protein